jgi:hypothetical protein
MRMSENTRIPKNEKLKERDSTKANEKEYEIVKLRSVIKQILRRFIKI